MAEPFSTGTGELELLLAIREVQRDNALLADAGIFLVNATREDELPYFLNAVYKPGTGMKKLSGRDSLRVLTIEMKAVAKEDGAEALEIAGPLVGANYALFGPGVGTDGLTARERLNAKLEAYGWTARMPLEQTGIGPYKDNLDDLERWHLGHLFKFWISPKTS